LESYFAADGTLIEVVPNQVGDLEIDYRLPMEFGVESVGLSGDSKNISLHTGVWGQETQVLNVGQRITNVGYSFDGRYLAAGYQGGMAVWRRMRAYGWKGWFELPLFWVAAVSFGGLLFSFIRRLRKKAIA